MITGRLHNKNTDPKVLVENKISFAAAESELSIYDTYESARRVKLLSDQLLFCGMVTGKKVMHAPSTEGGVETCCDFLPHESFVMAPNRLVEIDFPEAQMDAPTTCLAIEIATDRIHRVTDRLNNEAPLLKTFGEWHYRETMVHTHHNGETQALLNRIVQIFTENHPDRDFIIDLAVSELIARLLRHQTREFIMTHSQYEPDNNGINAVLNYMCRNVQEPLNIEKLCKMACMSRTRFFSTFRRHLGCTPSAFQQQLRLKKAAALIEKGEQITSASYRAGFSNPSHFSRCFKGFFGLTPNQYKNRHAG